MSKIEWRRAGGGRWIATVTRDEEAGLTALNNLLAGALVGWNMPQAMPQYGSCPYCQQPRPYWNGGPIPGPGLFGGILGGLGI